MVNEAGVSARLLAPGDGPLRFRIDNLQGRLGYYIGLH
jgi:hypothetical protein